MRRQADYLPRVRAVAKAKGGQCLSSACNATADKVTLQCAKGHVWKAEASAILKPKGTWCMACFRASRGQPLDRVRAAAKAKAGQCLSSACASTTSKITLQCEAGHVWDARAGAILKGQWCKCCYVESRKGLLDDMRQIAMSRGGKCLSRKYVHSQQKLRFRCHQGHVWDATPNAILTGRWCRKCADATRRTSLSDVQKMAAARGGKCISTEYVNLNARMMWACGQGHQWEATLAAMAKRATWCMFCRKEDKRNKAVKYKTPGEPLRFGKAAS